MNAADIVKSIDELYRKKAQSPPRSYIGASSIGDQCDASLQFQLRGFDQTAPEPRLQRIFDLGNQLERAVIRDLRLAGLQVFEVDALTGRQHNFSQFGGHVSCNLDGQVFLDEQVYALEIKTMGDKQFKDFSQNGVRSSHPKYFDQMTMCMGLSGIRGGILVAYNKNTSEYHAEFVAFDQDNWDYMVGRINLLLGGARGRVAKDETDWRCRSCWRSDLCWGHRELTKRELSRCQSCAHSRPIEDGTWFCELRKISAQEVCSHFEQLRPEARK